MNREEQEKAVIDSIRQVCKDQHVGFKIVYHPPGENQDILTWTATYDRGQYQRRVMLGAFCVMGAALVFGVVVAVGIITFGWKPSPWVCWMASLCIWASVAVEKIARKGRPQLTDLELQALITIRLFEKFGIITDKDEAGNTRYRHFIKNE